MSVWSRLRLLVRAKASRALDRVEDPGETLDYAYGRQIELLQEVRRGMTAVVATKKQLEAQAGRLDAQASRLHSQARVALERRREDLARHALERRSALLAQVGDVRAQVTTLEAKQAQLVTSQRVLAERIARFRTEKEATKASYEAAKAMVAIGEAATGLGRDMADVGLAVQRAREKTDALAARAAALDELVATGALDAGDSGSHLDRELAALSSGAQVETELAALKGEVVPSGPLPHA